MIFDLLAKRSMLREDEGTESNVVATGTAASY